MWLKVIVLLMSIKYCTNANEIKMIADIIEASDKSTSVLANVCWKASKKVQLMSKLNSMERPTTIRFTKTAESLPADDFIRREYLLFVADINCPGIKAFFSQASAKKKFGFPYRWIVVGASTNGSIVPDSLNQSNLLTDADVIISQKWDDDFYSLYMLYKMDAKSEWVYEDYGDWASDTGLKKSELATQSISVRRKNFSGKPIVTTMVVVDNRTIANPYDLSNVEVDTLSKANIRHVDVLYDFINATRVIKFTRTWGYFINGSWNGMIGHFVRGESDIAATIMFITQERLNVVNFINHPTDLLVAFVFREPPLSYHSNLFLLPFNKTVWACMAGFVLILIIIIYVNAFWESIKSKNMNVSDQTALRPKLSDIIVLLISAICQQGSSLELKGGVGRIIIFIIFLTFLFLYTSYSANIVALLQSSSNHIRTLADLYNSKMELGIENLPYNIYFFSAEKEPLRKAIFENKVAPKGRTPNYLSLEEGVKRLQTKPFAFNMNTQVGYRLVNKYFHEHEKCGIQQIPYIQRQNPWLSCAKNSSYTEIFKIGLQRGSEHGLLDRVNKLIYAKKPLCVVRGGSFISVNMVDFYPVLLMLLYGMLLSILFLLIEILIHRKTLANN